jgi:outer membrane receptor protein involved in Fe transport
MNYDYASARGFDLSLIRRFNSGWSGHLNYSLMLSEANRDNPFIGYYYEHTLSSMPKRARPVGWDQPHRLTAVLDLTIPTASGPEVGGVHLLERVTVSVIARASAGRPYTPTTPDVRAQENSGRLPWSYQLDLRIYRDFTLLGLEWSLFANIRNLFDRRNVWTVYSYTGKPDDPGPGATHYSDSYDRWHYFGTPRLIDLGLRIHF